jgi:hypothetical protein
MRAGFVRLALSVAALLTLLCGAARAEIPRLVPTGNFAAEGPMGVAVDNSASGSSRGDVYVGNFFHFLPEGSPLPFEVPKHSEKFDASGKLLLPFGEEGIYSGVAVNPTNGDVYVLSLALQVGTYDPVTGVPVGEPFTVPPSGNLFGLTAVQIASDSAGNVYVPVAQSSEECGSPATTCVLEYSPAGEKLKAFTGSGALKGPVGVTVDSAGNVWVADAGGNRIEELNPADQVVKMIKAEGVTSVALDPRGDVLAIVGNQADSCGELTAPCNHLVVYSSAGTQLQDLGAGDFGVMRGQFKFELPSMVAVNESSGRVYVTDDGKGRVWTFDLSRPPLIRGEFTAEVGTSAAKLGARVEPSGIETHYRFEYGTSESYGQTAPSPEGSVGEGVSSRTVWATATGLAPGTTYHYRVVVTSALGEQKGPDQTFTTETAAETSCPGNEGLRTGFSASLPDCRAYELVTPPNSASAQPDPDHGLVHFREGGGVSGNQAARDGSRMSFQSTEVLPGSLSGGVEYVSTRDPGGWLAEDVVPLESYTGDRCIASSPSVEAYSADVSKAVLAHDFGTPGKCSVELVEAVRGEPEGVKNLLLRDSTTLSYRLIDVTPPGVAPGDTRFLGASANLEHVVFAERAPLVSGAPVGVEDVYEWSGGTLGLVTVLPDGTPVAGPEPFQGLSADGSVALFAYEGALYARLHGERTFQVDATQGLGVSGAGALKYVTADGSRVFFTDASRLTPDSTAEGGKPDLYECQIVEVEEAGVRKPRCDLKDLTVASGGEHADVGEAKGEAPVFSEDGSYVYFTASAVLAHNSREYEGVGGEPVLEKALAGERNLYAWHEGAVSFIAQGLRGAEAHEAQASPDGRYLAVTTTKPLTGYQNTGAPEIFIYSATTGQISCVSCKPSGEPPTAGGAITGGAPHDVTDNGRLFFQTAEALLPADTNGRTDVYEYEAGQLHLISTGTSSSGSVLLDTSDNGQDVFFLTRQKLLPQDTNEEALSIYDARVNGGFPEPLSPPACTTPEACRGASAPPPTIFGVPASQTFSGVGNAVPQTRPPVRCKKGFVKKKGRCVKRVKRRARKANKSAHANHKTGR